MEFNERKLHFIEDYLKVSDKEVMDELDEVLHKRKSKNIVRVSFRKFSGILTSAEVKKMSEIIEEGCETVDVNGWK